MYYSITSIRGRDAMRDDPYSINPYNNESFKTDTEICVPWNSFLNAIGRVVEKDMMPGDKTKHALLDKNCWLLYFYGHRERDKRTAKDIINIKNYHKVDEGLFPHNVKILFTIFDFDLKSFYEVWEYQHNIKRLLKQVVHEDFFIGNRFSKRKGLHKPQYQLICWPSRHENINPPKMHKILDGLLFPVIVSKNNHNYQVQRLQTTNFGDGDFITCNNEIIDCIRINDFWQTRNHLKQRLSFSFLVQTDYDEAPMIICNNMQDIKDAWRLLGANADDGVLIRSLGETLYENYWLILNKDSSFVGTYTKYGFTMHNRGTHKRGFVTLEGRHVGTLGYNYTALKQMRWLDKFDIERFQSIVFQTDDYNIGSEVLDKNNQLDESILFDFSYFSDDI